MALPSWLTYNVGGRVAGFIAGLGTAALFTLGVTYALPSPNTRFKNRSALYGGRKVPDGEDPWEY